MFENGLGFGGVGLGRRAWDFRLRAPWVGGFTPRKPTSKPIYEF